MSSIAQLQSNRLLNLVRAALACRPEAERGLLFSSRAGLALVNAAFDLFECDALYDLAGDINHELGDEAGSLDLRGERKILADGFK